MDNFRNLFSIYEMTDPPPIITEDYKKVKDNYEQYILPAINNLEDNSENNSEITWIKNNKSVSKIMSESSKQNIVQYFVNKGLTLNQAKGIYGNLMQESGGNLNITSRDGYNSYGLAQWTGPRKERLFQKYGTRPTLQQQLDFIWEELNTTEKNALLALKKTNTISDATKVFMDKYERPNKRYANFNNRLKYAQSV